MKNHTLKLSAADALLLAEGALAAVSPDRTTPVITGAHIAVSETKVVVTATDRHRMHQMTFVPSGAPQSVDYILPVEALKWIKQFAKRAIASAKRSGHNSAVVSLKTTFPDSGNHRVTVSVSDSDWEGADSFTLVTDLIKGNYPPVGKLIDDARDAEEGFGESINLKHASLASTLDRSGADKPRMKFVKRTSPTKPGPMLMDFVEFGKSEPYASALIQPFNPRM